MLNIPNDPGVNYRKGFLLTIGATKGKNLFEGMVLTAKYFFDAVNAKYAGSLEYRHIETLGDMEKHPTAKNDIRESVLKLVKPFLSRKTETSPSMVKERCAGMK